MAATYVDFSRLNNGKERGRTYWCQSDSPRGIMLAGIRPSEASVLPPFEAESHQRVDRQRRKTRLTHAAGLTHPPLGNRTQTMASLLYGPPKKIIVAIRRELISAFNTRNELTFVANEPRGLAQLPQLILSFLDCHNSLPDPSCRPSKPPCFSFVKHRTTGCGTVKLIDNSPRQHHHSPMAWCSLRQ